MAGADVSCAWEDRGVRSRGGGAWSPDGGGNLCGCRVGRQGRERGEGRRRHRRPAANHGSGEGRGRGGENSVIPCRRK
jgi:hypothetical protein